MSQSRDFDSYAAMDKPRINVTPPGPKAKKLITEEEAITNPVYGRDTGLVVEKATGVWVEDPDGNRFLDCTSGIGVTNVGHSQPSVTEAVRKQADRFLHFCGADFYYDVQTELQRKLMAVVPVDEPVVFFTNSGAESTEAAMKITRYHRRRPRYMALRDSFHGRTFGAMSMTASKSVQRKNFAPLVPEVTHVPNPYCYRCPLREKYPSCGIACVDVIEEYFDTICPASEVAGFFAEPIQGEGGYIVPPPEYFPKLKALLAKHDIPLVMDEVQAGNGRTGKMFASEHWGIRPDVLYTAKGLGAGMPIGAMISSRKITDWKAGAHANTYGGNPVACSAALASMELLSGGLVNNAAVMGKVFLNGLRELQQKHERIGDVRGKGLMLAIEMVKAPNPGKGRLNCEMPLSKRL
ncbi:MAG: aminotransferase class III-fold pyridoxal phosphate-dependent enzyme [Planctomycetota bacterium]|nr:aminotransferase class III-fold pyridoxal phosphate-dependent enzyme [Planctomycetota bacterium]